MSNQSSFTKRQFLKMAPDSLLLRTIFNAWRFEDIKKIYIYLRNSLRDIYHELRISLFFSLSLEIQSEPSTTTMTCQLSQVMMRGRRKKNILIQMKRLMSIFGIPKMTRKKRPDTHGVNVQQQNWKKNLDWKIELRNSHSHFYFLES